MSGSARSGLTAVSFLAGFAFFLFLFSKFPVLHDDDSYYHLAVARAYAEEGLLEDLPWARFSVMHEGFGDKELLFHLFLTPFASSADASAGGKAALALLCAAVIALMANLAMRAIGHWGFFIPFLVFGTSASFTARMLKLRPEIAALFLLMLAAWFAGRRRYLLLGLTAAVYTLSYTAFQVIVILALLWFLHDGWVRRTWRWALPLSVLAGLLAGLLVHPQFPANLRVWFYQNVHYFRFKELLDVGAEILPHTTRDAVLFNAGWFAGLLVLWLSREKKGDSPPPDGVRDCFLLSAAAFGVLFILMQRFATYFVPFATLGLCFTLAARGEAPGRWMPLPGRGRVPFALAFGAALLGALPVSNAILETLWKGAVMVDHRREDMEALGRAVPEGGRVAAPWGETGVYMFWAPQASYLNVLDPVFMYVPHRERRLLEQDLFAGLTPDVPLRSAVDLESDLVAYSPLFGKSGKVYERLKSDPRAELLYGGLHHLYRLHPGRNGRFLLDWKVPAAPGGGGEAPGWVPYPRLPRGGGGEWEGFVDAGRVSGGASCVTFAGEVVVEEASRVTYELAPYGPTAFRVDGRPIAFLESSLQAVLGKGLVIPLDLEAGSHIMEVRTCPSGGYGGFYFVERGKNPR